MLAHRYSAQHCSLHLREEQGQLRHTEEEEEEKRERGMRKSRQSGEAEEHDVMSSAKNQNRNQIHEIIKEERNCQENDK